MGLRRIFSWLTCNYGQQFALFGGYVKEQRYCRIHTCPSILTPNRHIPLYRNEYAGSEIKRQRRVLFTSYYFHLHHTFDIFFSTYHFIIVTAICHIKL